MPPPASHSAFSTDMCYVRFVCNLTSCAQARRWTRTPIFIVALPAAYYLRGSFHWRFRARRTSAGACCITLACWRARVKWLCSNESSPSIYWTWRIYAEILQYESRILRWAQGRGGCGGRAVAPGPLQYNTNFNEHFMCGYQTLT